MGGFFRFLLGSALGAAVGIAIAQKRSATSRKEISPVSQVGPAPAPTRPGGRPAGRLPGPEITAAPPVSPASVPAGAYVRVTPPVAPVVPAAQPLRPPPVAAPPVAAPPVAAPPAAPATPPPFVAAPVAPVAAPPLAAAAPPPAPVAGVPTSESASPGTKTAPVVPAPPVGAIPPQVVTPSFEEVPPASVYEVPPVGGFEDFLIRGAAASAVLPGTPVEQAPPALGLDETAFGEAELAGLEMAGASDIVLTPGVLEEPVPGFGWEPSSTLVEEQEAFEELLPVVPEEILPRDAVELEQVPAESTVDWGASPIAEVPVEAPVIPVIETAAPPITETPVASILAAAAAATAPPSPAPPASPTPVVEVLAGDDLRARIEATRRRIREELEQPFARVEGFEFAEPTYPLDTSRPEPISAPGPQAATVQPPLTSATVATPPVSAPGTAPVPPPVAAPAAAPGPVAAPGESSSRPGADGDGANLEYEAMRARIEMTRSRLKAKAFDAMMAGESALLGRDPNGAQSKPVRIDGVDREIEHTVESSLREQED